MRAGRRILSVMLAAGVIVAIAYAFRPTLIGPTKAAKDRMEDTNTLRYLSKPVAETGDLPLRDGGFDPYAYVRRGDVVREQFDIFRSARSGTGPTDEEIERGDYTNFPWERYRGDGKLEGPPVPLLWERKPDKEGKVLVALSDGTVVHREPR